MSNAGYVEERDFRADVDRGCEWLGDLEVFDHKDRGAMSRGTWLQIGRGRTCGDEGLGCVGQRLGSFVGLSGRIEERHVVG